MKRLSLKGQQFYNLFVIEEVKVNKKGTWWKCQCSCGNVSVYPGTDLTRRTKYTTKACKACSYSLKSTKLKTHGCAHNYLYNTFMTIIGRCENPKNQAYSRYGGRGITIYPAWRHDFLAFYNYVGERPSKEYSLDRIDNDKGYEPGNLRWATKREQALNTRRTNNGINKLSGTYKKGKRYQVRIQGYASMEEAHAAYKEMTFKLDKHYQYFWQAPPEDCFEFYK